MAATSASSLLKVDAKEEHGGHRSKVACCTHPESQNRRLSLRASAQLYSLGRDGARHLTQGGAGAGAGADANILVASRSHFGWWDGDGLGS